MLDASIYAGGGRNTVLDPFMGSGAVGCECVRRRINYIGIEKDSDMFGKANERINSVAVTYSKLGTLDPWVIE